MLNNIQPEDKTLLEQKFKERMPEFKKKTWNLALFTKAVGGLPTSPRIETDPVFICYINNSKNNELC